MKIEYSILRYRPDLLTGESVNIGIAFHNLETDTRDFNLISNFSRLWAFDDELDQDFTTDTIKGIKNEWLNGSLFNDFNSLKTFTRFFVNEFYFSKVEKEVTFDYKRTKEILTKGFLKRGLAKNERLSKQEELEFVERYFKSNKVDFRKKESLMGILKDPIIFDYYVQSGNINFGIKYITNVPQSVNTLRSLLFYAQSNPGINISIMLEKDINESINQIKGLVEYGVENELFEILRDDHIDKLFA